MKVLRVHTIKNNIFLFIEPLLHPGFSFVPHLDYFTPKCSQKNLSGADSRSIYPKNNPYIKLKSNHVHAS